MRGQTGAYPFAFCSKGSHNMRKNILLACVFSLLLIGCSSIGSPSLAGSYQSEHVDGYMIQMTFQPRDNSFVEYIDNRQVDKGTYEEIKKGLYKINGEVQEIEIYLNRDNSFEIVIKKLNQGKPIQLKNIDDTPIYIGTEFDDVEEYKDLLK